MGVCCSVMVRTIVVVAVVSLTASCSSFWHPAGSDITAETSAARLNSDEDKNVKAHFSFAEARAYALDLRDAYQSKIDEQYLIRNLSDLAFIPIAGLAAFYGISSAHQDVVLGLAVGGTANYLIGQRFSRPSEQLIYAAGVLSVNCVLRSFEPISKASGYQIYLRDLVGGLTYKNGQPVIMEEGTIDKTITELEYYLTLYEINDQISANARAIIQTAKSVRDTTGKQVLTVLDSSGNELELAVSDVKAKVSESLTNRSLDPGRYREAVVAAFRSATVTIPQAEDVQAEKSTNNFSDPQAQKYYKNVTDTAKELERQIRSVREIAELAGSLPEAASLENCAIDVDEAGLTLSVSRPGPINVELPENGGPLVDPQVLSLTISGGQPPYRASWSGVYPGKNVLGVPNITTGGVLTAALNKGLVKGTYELEVLDSSQRTQPIIVKIQVGPVSSNGSGSPDQGSDVPPKITSADVKAAREILRKSEYDVKEDGEADEQLDQLMRQCLTILTGEPAKSFDETKSTELIARLKRFQGNTCSIKSAQQFLKDAVGKPDDVSGEADDKTKEALQLYFNETHKIPLGDLKKSTIDLIADLTKNIRTVQVKSGAAATGVFDKDTREKVLKYLVTIDASRKEFEKKNNGQLLAAMLVVLPVQVQ